jgi:hypothetical protein
MFSNGLNHENNSSAYFAGVVCLCHGEVARDYAAAFKFFHGYQVAARVWSRAQDVVLLIASASPRL